MILSHFFSKSKQKKVKLCQARICWQEKKWEEHGCHGMFMKYSELNMAKYSAHTHTHSHALMEFEQNPKRYQLKIDTAMKTDDGAMATMRLISKHENVLLLLLLL